MKNHCLPYKSELPFPLSTQYDVENQKKSQVVVFNIVSRGGGGVRLDTGEVVFASECAQKRQKCTFVPGLLSLTLVSNGFTQKTVVQN